MNLHDLFPNASPAFLALNSGQATKPQRPVRYAALGQAKAKASDPKRFLVRIESRRRRLIDADNLTAKFHIDCLRYCGLLPDDSPKYAEIQVGQVKIGPKEEERIEITVQPLP